MGSNMLDMGMRVAEGGEMGVLCIYLWLKKI